MTEMFQVSNAVPAKSFGLPEHFPFVQGVPSRHIPDVIFMPNEVVRDLIQLGGGPFGSGSVVRW